MTRLAIECVRALIRPLTTVFDIIVSCCYVSAFSLSCVDLLLFYNDEANLSLR